MSAPAEVVRGPGRPRKGATAAPSTSSSLRECQSEIKRLDSEYQAARSARDELLEKAAAPRPDLGPLHEALTEALAAVTARDGGAADTEALAAARDALATAKAARKAGDEAGISAAALAPRLREIADKRAPLRAKAKALTQQYTLERIEKLWAKLLRAIGEYNRDATELKVWNRIYGRVTSGPDAPDGLSSGMARNPHVSEVPPTPTVQQIEADILAELRALGLSV